VPEPLVIGSAVTSISILTVIVSARVKLREFEVDHPLSLSGGKGVRHIVPDGFTLSVYIVWWDLLATIAV
jgi:hypothetical protein